MAGAVECLTLLMLLCLTPLCFLLWLCNSSVDVVVISHYAFVIMKDSVVVFVSADAVMSNFVIFLLPFLLRLL